MSRLTDEQLEKIKRSLEEIKQAEDALESPYRANLESDSSRAKVLSQKEMDLVLMGLDLSKEMTTEVKLSLLTELQLLREFRKVAGEVVEWYANMKNWIFERFAHNGLLQEWSKKTPDDFSTFPVKWPGGLKGHVTCGGKRARALMASECWQATKGEG